MKKKLIFLLMISISCYIFSQNDREFMDINNVKALIKSNANFFSNDSGFPTTYAPAYFVPQDSMTSTILNHTFWIGGLDNNDSLHVAAGFYDGYYGQDYHPGPISTNYDAAYDQKYDRVWKINKSEIDNHKINYNSAGYVMPEVIQNWPYVDGTYYLAPFLDLNSNGDYEPQNGEYPYIKGDQEVFFVFNDDRAENTCSGGKRLGIEIRATSYAYNSTIESINNTLFVNYKIINKSANTYHDTYFGLFVNADLGFCWDDYIGCDTSRHMFYACNGDHMDGDGTNGTFGPYIGDQGVMLLNYDLEGFMKIEGTQTVLGNPEEAGHFYNYMKSTWKDSIHLTYGGIGYQATGGVPVNHMFPGQDGNDWSEWSEGNSPYEREMIGSGYLSVLDPGEVVSIDVAFIFARADSNLQSMSELQAAADTVRDFYNQNNLGDWTPTAVFSLDKNVIDFKLYPNPASDYVMIENNAGIKNFELYNLLGEKVLSAKLQNGQNRLDLSHFSSGCYFYHVPGSKKSGRVIINK